MKRALIVGSDGQDGSLLYDRLTGDGVPALGLARDSIRGGGGNEFKPVGVHSRTDVKSLLKKWRPSEIYYLAAVHQASEDAVKADDVRLFEESLSVHVTGLVNLLDVLKEMLPHASVFYAASSLVFGDAEVSPQDESTPFQPRCIYGITKVAGVQVCRYYRERHGVRVSAGFLYNHESPIRRENFVSRKIVRAATNIAAGGRDKLVIGNLSAQVDWGYAPDVIDAMIRIVRQPRSDDYIVATGETHSVREFVEIAFDRLGLDWRLHVEERPMLLTRRSTVRVGDATRLREHTGWRPTISFRRMVEILVDAERGVHAA